MSYDFVARLREILGSNEYMHLKFRSNVHVFVAYILFHIKHQISSKFDQLTPRDQWLLPLPPPLTPCSVCVRKRVKNQHHTMGVGVGEGGRELSEGGRV